MYNKAQLLGRTGEDPYYQVLDDGKELAELSFVTEEHFGDLKYTEWHRIKAWGPLASIIQKHGFKGQLLFIEGRIHYSKWKDTAGNVRYSTEIIANTVKILQWKNEAESSG